MAEITDDEAIRLAVEEDPDFAGKAIPYLGWFWRNWDYGRLSLAPVGDAGRVAIDAANKWDYPCCAVSDGDRVEILGHLVAMGRARQRILDILEGYRAKMKAIP